MNTAHENSVVRKIAFFTLIGAGVVFLGGPVIGVVAVVLSLFIAAVSIILPFAIVGFLVWLPFHILAHGPHETWKDAGKNGKALGEAFVLRPMRWCGRSCRQMAVAGENFAEGCRATGSFLARHVFEPACGCLVGTLTGAAVGMENGHLSWSIGGGAAFGALVGLAVNMASRPRNSSEQCAVGDGQSA